jgi:hypothetical protein
MSEYMEIEDRRNVIRQYASTFNIHTFVETGTSDGSTTAALIPDFDQLYTIEIDEGWYNHAQLLFANESKVSPILGDSTVKLPEIVELLQKTNTPALYWLDGHYCGGATRGLLDSPVVAELTAVFYAPKGSVILVDDARIFGGGAAEGGDNGENYSGYPALAWVAEWSIRADLHYALKDDIIRLSPYVQDS